MLTSAGSGDDAIQVGVCTEQLSFGADGNADPIVCADGAINTVAWQYFLSESAGLLSAGEYATPPQIQGLEAAAQGWTEPIGESVYCLAAAYYGWRFAVNLDPESAASSSATCASDIPNWP